MEDAKKRIGPKRVAPVTHQGIRYEALQWGKTRDLGQNGGHIEAFDARTNRSLWTLKVYDITYDPDEEPDAQDVFITKLWVSGLVQKRLMVENERGERFTINLKDRSVQREK